MAATENKNPSFPPLFPGPPRKRPRKRFQVLFGGLFILAALLVLALYLIPVNSYRGPIAEGMSRATGLAVEIGSLNLSLWHGLDLECRELKIYTPDRDRQLFSLETLFLDVELIPLLQKKVRVKSASLVKPVVQIYPAPKAPETPAESTSEKTPEKLTPEQFRFKTVQHALKKTELNLENITVTQGRVILVAASGNAEQNVSIDVSTRISVHRSPENKMDLRVDTFEIRHDKLAAHGHMEGKDLLGKSPLLEAEVESDPFALADLLELGSLIPAETQTLLQNQVAGNLNRVMVHTEVPLLQVHNLSTLLQHGTGNLSVNADSLTLNLPQGTLGMTQIEGQGNWKANRVNHSLEAAVGEGWIKSKGETGLAADGKPVYLNTLVELDRADLAQLKPKEDNDFTPTAGRLSGEIHLDGPLPPSDAPLDGLNLKGNLVATNLFLGYPQTQYGADKITLEVKQPSIPARFQGTLVLEQAHLKKIAFKKMAADFRVTPEKIEIAETQWEPNHGTLLMSGQFLPADSTYSLKFSGHQLEGRDWLPESVSGQVNLEGHLAGGLKSFHEAQNRGEKPTVNAILRDANGGFKLDLLDGGLLQLGLLESVLKLLNPHTLITARKEGLNYDRIGGDFAIKDGILTTGNFLMDGPTLRFRAQAMADF
ncbi:MAG: hypothetical protein COV67_12420, partial [Nitrospinae bacterium CG11_big_fil_rev_8_21_14_0_20_56_8]